MSQYLLQRLNRDQGLTGIVTAIAQTPDGYLWVGTDRALLRFDGQIFSPVKVANPDITPISHVLSLAVDDKGALWIWMQGMPIIRYENGTFRYGFSEINPMAGISAMAHTSDGSVLLSTAGQRIVRFNNSTMDKVGRSPGPLVVSLAQTSDGKVWLGTRDSGLFYLENGLSHTPAGRLPDKKINCLFSDDRGQLWIGTDDGLALWNGRAVSTIPMPARFRHVQVSSIMQDRNNNTWVGTQLGLLRYDSAGVVSIFRGPEKDESPINALFEDRENNIWVSGAQNIDRLREGAFSTFSSAEGLPGDAYGPVYVDPQERVWFAPISGGLYWMRDGEVHPIKADGLNSDIVYSIDGSNDGVWIGRQTGGLTHLHFNGSTIAAETYKFRNGIYPYVIYAVHEDRDKSIWIGTLTGGARHITKGVVKTYLKQDGVGSDRVSAIEEGDDGTVYFGTPDGLSVLHGDHWKHYSDKLGLPSNFVTTLFNDKDGILWVGTQSGLAYLSAGSMHSVAKLSFQLHEHVLGIAEDRKGMLWISTVGRILRVNRESLLHQNLNPGDIREFGLSDGLRGFGDIRRSRPVVSDTMGRIWISTIHGLSVIDTSLRTQSSAPAITHIESMIVDGQPVALDSRVLSTAAQKRIAFHYAGLSFSTPGSVRFRYRLDGFDHAWSGSTVARDAIYTNLSPGLYRFRVEASNDEGDWTEDEASVSFRIAPLFWQRWEFALLCGLFACVLAIAIYHLRMQSIIDRASRRFNVQLAERTRIAQELHDTLLQGFFSASMQLHVVIDQIPDTSATRPQLERILRLMGKVLDEGRDAVYGLRSTDDKSIRLEDSFRSFFHEFGDNEGVKYSVKSDGGSRELRPGIQEEICRICQEALRNAYRHAQAKSIDVAIHYTMRFLTIEIRDDGCGAEPEVLAHGRMGHWGFLGMRERAGSIGAKLRIANGATGGVTVTLRIAGNIAYRKYSSNVVLNWIIQILRSRPLARLKGDSDRAVTGTTRV